MFSINHAKKRDTLTDKNCLCKNKKSVRHLGRTLWIILLFRFVFFLDEIPAFAGILEIKLIRRTSQKLNALHWEIQPTLVILIKDVIRFGIY
jgi:hypothetical protein